MVFHPPVWSARLATTYVRTYVDYVPVRSVRHSMKEPRVRLEIFCSVVQKVTSIFEKNRNGS